MTHEPVIELLRAHNLAADVAAQVKALGLDRTFVAHGLMCEAMMQLLDCDPERADKLARGFVTLAVADQKQYVADKASDLIDRAIRGDLKSDRTFGPMVMRTFDAGKSLLMGSAAIPPTVI
jgi:predicted alpha/beta hydrolase family esterase